MTYVYLLKNRLEIVDRATSVCDLLSIILISETLVACVFFLLDAQQFSRPHRIYFWKDSTCSSYCFYRRKRQSRVV